jgi:hypothetical protein
MPHHYPKSCVEASIWCNRCGKETPWRIADGRRQFCLICYVKPVERKTAIETQDQGDLFGKELEP